MKLIQVIIVVIQVFVLEWLIQWCISDVKIFMSICSLSKECKSFYNITLSVTDIVIEMPTIWGYMMLMWNLLSVYDGWKKI